jgi:hypothetical protein
MADNESFLAYDDIYDTESAYNEEDDVTQIAVTNNKHNRYGEIITRRY